LVKVSPLIDWFLRVQEGVGDSWVELSHSITIMGNVFENQSLLARREAKPQRKTKPKNSSHKTKDNILEEN